MIFLQRSWFGFRSLAFLLLGIGVCELTGTRVNAADEPATKIGVFVGTYTGNGSEGIYHFEFDTTTGEGTSSKLVAKTTNPSFLALHPSKRFLYAVNEVDTFEGKPGGAVSAFAIKDANGELTPLNFESTKGGSPCHLIVDKAGKNVLAANYGGGSVAVLPIQDDGKLGAISSFIQHQGSGPRADRQSSPHAHSVNLDAANAFAFVADLGLDRVLIYKFDPDKGTLTPNDPAFARTAPASGPRHFDFHPTGKYAYAIDELDSTITGWTYDSERGALLPLQILSTLPKGNETVNHPADIHAHPNGIFLYGSNRGDDSIAVYTLVPLTGKLTFVETAKADIKNPRNFAIDPSGQFVLVGSHDNNKIVVFQIDPTTGALTPNGKTIDVPRPVCLKFDTLAK